MRREGEDKEEIAVGRHKSGSSDFLRCLQREIVAAVAATAVKNPSNWMPTSLSCMRLSTR